MEQTSRFGSLNFCRVWYILLGIIINFRALYILYNIIIIRFIYLPIRFVYIIYSRCSLVFRSKPKIINTSSVRYLENVGTVPISNIFICEAQYCYNGTRDYLRTLIASRRSYHNKVSTWSQLGFIHQFPEVIITSGKFTINLKPIHFVFTAKFKYRCS